MSCEELLKEISHIKEKYDEIAKITGDNFNIFEILGTEHDELSHSRFLAELLTPKGTHDCGILFLELFFKLFLSDKYNIGDIDFKNCQVYREHTTDYGRLDIYIKCGDVSVAIENKIYADDGVKQLKRYSDFLSGKNNCLIYLTLNGKMARDGSHRGVEYMRLAYGRKNGDEIGDTNSDAEDKSVFAGSIIDWLKCCQKEAFNKPLVRETIEQYINLLKFLTNQTRSNKMSEEIIEKITTTAENWISAVEISNNLSNAMLKIIKDKIVPLMSMIGCKLKLDVDCENLLKYYSKRWYGINFSKPEWKRFKIRFEFLNSNLQNLIYGLNNPTPDDDWKKYLPNLHHPDFTTNRWWPFYKFMDKYRYWDNNFFSDLYSDTGRIGIAEEFENKIKEILSIVESSGYEL